MLPTASSLARQVVLCSVAGVLALLAGGTLPSAAQTAAAHPDTSGLTVTVNDFANNSNGYGTLNGIMQASDGNYYLPGQGSATNILRVLPNSGDTAGTLSTLAGQLASVCGEYITSNLVEASDGNLYGLTSNGAANGYGALFKYVIATRTCTPVYSFNQPVDGAYPNTFGGGLLYGNDGNFYGVFRYGGANENGTAFQITPAGVYHTIYTFCATNASGCPDGQRPDGYLIQATDGNFYGVTDNGGSGANQGVFYQIVPGATFPWVETALFNISGSQGYNPAGPIVEGPDGDLYGAMSAGGANDGDGSIFQYDFQGDFLDFYDFSQSYQDPRGLIVGGDGNLYGTTQGYTCECPGDLFQLTPQTGVYTDLGGFTASSLTQITGQIIQGSDGDFYGTGSGGGTKTYGGVYQGVPSTRIPAPVQVTLSASTTSGSPVTVNWKVLNATSDTYRNCYLYSQPAGGGNFTGKAVGTQNGAMLSGSVSVTPTATGTYTYAVTCGGTESGISSPLTVTGLAAAATQTSLSITPNPISIGASGTLTATVTRTSGGAVPGGSVTFEYGSLILATINLTSGSNGVAHYTASTTGLGPGTYGITAHYSPDSTDMASVSNTFNEVLKYPTTTTVSVTPGTITVGNNATITVHVTGPTNTPVPSGSVTIYANGGAVISNYPLSNGSATIVAPTTGFPKGTYQVTAGYNGSSLDNTSTSTADSVTLD